MDNKKNIKGTKYAFNINDINSPKNFKGTLSDFKSLNRGTYDEIEADDIAIKNNLEKLKILKNDTIKQLVYTNKDIPVQWKNKLDYKQNLLKIFINDTNFLNYIGIGELKEISKSTKNKEKREFSTKKNNTEKKSFEIKDISKESDQEKITNTPNRTLANKNLAKFGRFKEKNNYTDKEIIGILEDFKSAYPILIKEKDTSELHQKRKKNVEIEMNKTNYDFNEKKNINNYTLPNLKLKTNKRKNTFRQNIFTNLLPSRTNNIMPKFEGNKTSRNFYQKPKMRTRNQFYACRFGGNVCNAPDNPLGTNHPLPFPNAVVGTAMNPYMLRPCFRRTIQNACRQTSKFLTDIHGVQFQNALCQFRLVAIFRKLSP